MSQSRSERDRAFEAYWAQEYATALRLLLPLAAGDDPEAQCAVASLYQLGLGVTAHGVEALRWYTQAAAGGSALACNNLWTLYSLGCAGVPPDASEARRWRDEARRRGFPDLAPG